MRLVLMLLLLIAIEACAPEPSATPDAAADAGPLPVCATFCTYGASTYDCSGDPLACTCHYSRDGQGEDVPCAPGGSVVTLPDGGAACAPVEGGRPCVLPPP